VFKSNSGGPKPDLAVCCSVESEWIDCVGTAISPHHSLAMRGANTRLQPPTIQRIHLTGWVEVRAVSLLRAAQYIVGSTTPVQAVLTQPPLEWGSPGNLSPVVPTCQKLIVSLCGSDWSALRLVLQVTLGPEESGSASAKRRFPGRSLTSYVRWKCADLVAPFLREERGLTPGRVMNSTSGCPSVPSTWRSMDCSLRAIFIMASAW